MHRLLVLLLLVGWDWPEANPGRPSFSDNAAATATGAFELEAGLASSDEGDTGSAQWTFKYGLHERADVRFNLEHSVWGSDDLDLGGTSLLLKLVARMPADQQLGLAFEPYVTFPTGGVDWGGGLAVVGTYITHDFQIDANVVVDVTRADMQDTAVTVTPIVAVGHPIVGELGAFVEGLVDIAASGDGDTSPFVGLGVGYAITKYLVADAAFYVGDEPRTQVFVGFTYSMYVPPRRIPAP